MPSSTSLQGVIFDLDGVLCNTSRYHAQAWADLMHSLGYQPPADLEERVKGISRLESVKIALGSHVSQYSEPELLALAERKNACYVQAVAGITPADLYPGALDLFTQLKAAGIKIILGSASKNAKPLLDLLGITPFFDAIADGFAYQRGKPHPDVFWAGARMAGLLPAHCIVVEDATAGIDAALAGGFVAIGMGNYESLKHAHLFIHSLRELSVPRLRELHQRIGPTLPIPAEWSASPVNGNAQ